MRCVQVYDYDEKQSFLGHVELDRCAHWYWY